MDVDFVRKFIPVALSDDYNYDKSSQNSQLLCLYTIYRDNFNFLHFPCVRGELYICV
jgi:hypothetical protein